MQERFEIYISNFKDRKERMEKGRKLPREAYCVFFTYQPPYKLIKMGNFLEHLKIYEAKTRDLIKNDPENKKFYKEHYGSVIELLEKMEKTEQSKRNFTLIAPQTEYVQTFPKIYEKSNHISPVLLACGFLVAGVIVGTILLAIFAPEVLPIFLLSLLLVIAVALITIGAVFLLTYLANCISADALKEEPLGNPYLDGKVFFDVKLLQEAYTELHQLEDSANDEIIDAQHVSEISQFQ
ncbi:MAG: hypothetical protein H0T84_13645 [Tatlockia sp.]|nr:hypothetical protein [Tatlockia sp.]